jgi:hypothetical protein
MTKLIKIPAGPARGKLITECSIAELEEACTVVEQKLCAATSATSIAKHKQFVGAARPLLKRRKFPTGSFETTEEANMALRDAAEVGHLLAPSSQVAALLPGCALLVTAFRVDVKHETFPDDDDPTQLLPNKLLLDRLARDLGISWKPGQRTDNQRDPYVRSYAAEGVIKDFDTSPRGIQGSAGIDLRQGSPLVARLRERRSRDGYDVERRREYIDSHCDTTARLKAVRTLGVRSYTLRELERPFFAARLVLTGKTSDPVAKPIIAQHVVDSFRTSNDDLYGKRAAGGR